METKECSVCHETKNIQCFSHTTYKDGSLRVRNECKHCRSNKESQRRKDNKELFALQDKVRYETNKDKILQKNRAYRLQHAEEIKLQKKLYYNQNKDAILQYHANNKEQRNDRLKKKRQDDIGFRISQSLRARVHDVLKRYKADTFCTLLSCTKYQLLVWLKSQLYDDLTLDNYGEYWHVDHVIPVDFFDITNNVQQRICFNWSNLRPLKAKDNLTKTSNIVVDEILNHSYVLEHFLKHNTGYQTDIEKCWWQRVKLWYGNNPKDKKALDELLKWTIRSQASTPVIDQGKKKVQRLNGSGSEMSSQHL